jgi:hypothetical protein
MTCAARTAVLLFPLATAACAAWRPSSPARPSDAGTPLPGWCTTGRSADTPDDAYVSAAAMDPDLARAEDQARARIAQQVHYQLEQVFESSEQESQRDDRVTGASDRREVIRGAARLEHAELVEVVQRRHVGDVWCVLARIDRAKAAERLRAAYEQEAPAFRTAVRAALDDVSRPAEFTTAYRQARDLRTRLKETAAEWVGLVGRVATIDADQAMFARLREARVRALAQAPVKLVARGEAAGRLSSHVTRVLAALGVRTAPAGLPLEVVVAETRSRRFGGCARWDVRFVVDGQESPLPSALEACHRAGLEQARDKLVSDLPHDPFEGTLRRTLGARLPLEE